MNWQNFLLFVLLWSASCIPMYVAGRTKDLKLKTSMCVTDGILTVMSLIYLWYALPSTLYSLTVLVGYLILDNCAARALRSHGYDPYAELRP